MTEQHTITIRFQGDAITVLIENGQPFIAIRPIVDVLGLDWAGQFRVLKNDEVLSSTVVFKSTVDGGDGKRRKMLFLPLEYLNGWLFKISPSKCRADRRIRIIEYQRECFHVLHEYFWHGGAINPDADGMQLQILKGQLEHQEQYLPQTVKGEKSDVNGRPRVDIVRSYPRSKPRKPVEVRAAKHPDLFQEIDQ